MTSWCEMELLTHKYIFYLDFLDMYGLFFAAADCLKSLSFMYKLETFYSCDLLINSMLWEGRSGREKKRGGWDACRLAAAAWLLSFFCFFHFLWDTVMFLQTPHFVTFQSGMSKLLLRLSFPHETPFKWIQGPGLDVWQAGAHFFFFFIPFILRLIKKCQKTVKSEVLNFLGNFSLQLPKVLKSPVYHQRREKKLFFLQLKKPGDVFFSLLKDWQNN